MELLCWAFARSMFPRLAYRCYMIMLQLEPRGDTFLELINGASTCEPTFDMFLFGLILRRILCGTLI